MAIGWHALRLCEGRGNEDHALRSSGRATQSKFMVLESGFGEFNADASGKKVALRFFEDKAASRVTVRQQNGFDVAFLPQSVLPV
jgi:hypothetical protein